MKDKVEELMGIINKGSHSSHTFRAAYVLNCDEGEYAEKVTNEQISTALKIGIRPIDRIKKRFVEEGLEGVLERKPSTWIYEKKIRWN